MPPDLPILGAASAETWSRGFHIFAAMLAVGSLVFQRVALRPALLETPNPELADGIRRRWVPVVYLVITILLVTGFYQFMVAGVPKGKADSSYHMWFGMKFVAALAIFFLASALVGRSRALEKIRAKGSLWLSVAILLAIGVVAISLHLRSIHAPL